MRNIAAPLELPVVIVKATGSFFTKLAIYNYGTGNGLLTKQTYANGNSVSFTYDSLGRTKTATYADGRTLTYTMREKRSRPNMA